MAGQMNFSNTATGRLITRAWHALRGPGAGPNPTKGNVPLQMSDVHPHGSCARNWRPADFSVLFAPETPDAKPNRR